MLLLTKVVIGDGGDEEGGVSGPLLNTGQVEEGEAAGAAPHRLRPLDGGDANEAGQRSGLEQVADVLTGPEQPRVVATCLIRIGRAHV